MDDRQQTKTVAFALPDGLSLGGVTTWSIEMSRHLAEIGLPTALIEHATRYNTKLDIQVPRKVQLIDCSCLPHPEEPELVIADYLPRYRRVLPATIIPNWSYGTFAACAALAQEQAEALRVIGFAHSDEKIYYEWLTYHEPIIHKFVAVSQEIATQLAVRLPHRAQDIIIRPYAVDVPASLRRTYSCTPNPLQLIYAGRITEEQKRISDLIQLAQALTVAGVNFKLRIIGEGKDKNLLRHKLDLLDQSVRQHVSLEAGLSAQQMPEAWRLADIFILVSEYEGASIAMLEAMAQGCIPVVTQVSGAATAIQPEVNGFYVPVGDMMAMTQVIKTLDDNRNNLFELGQKAHQTIAENFGYKDYLDWFINLVDEVWQQPPRPWLAERPFLRLRARSQSHLNQAPAISYPTREEIIYNLSGEEIARRIPMRRLIQAIVFKLGNRSGLRWLYRFRGLGKKILGGR